MINRQMARKNIQVMKETGVLTTHAVLLTPSPSAVLTHSLRYSNVLTGFMTGNIFTSDVEYAPPLV